MSFERKNDTTAASALLSEPGGPHQNCQRSLTLMQGVHTSPMSNKCPTTSSLCSLNGGGHWVKKKVRRLEGAQDLTHKLRFAPEFVLCHIFLPESAQKSFLADFGQ